MKCYKYNIEVINNDHKITYPLIIEMTEESKGWLDRYINIELELAIEDIIGEERSYSLVLEGETDQKPDHVYIAPEWLPSITYSLSLFELGNRKEYYLDRAPRHFQSRYKQIKRYFKKGDIGCDIDADCICALFLDMIPSIYNWDILDRYSILRFIHKTAGW